MQEVNNHPDHSQAVVNPLNNDSISDAETLSPTASPTLVSDIKAAVQHIAIGVQTFPCAFGEPHIPQIEPVPTGVLHTVPDQVCWYSSRINCNELWGKLLLI